MEARASISVKASSEEEAQVIMEKLLEKFAESHEDLEIEDTEVISMESVTADSFLVDVSISSELSEEQADDLSAAIQDDFGAESVEIE